MTLLQCWRYGTRQRYFETIEYPGDAERDYNESMEAAPSRSSRAGIVVSTSAEEITSRLFLRIGSLGEHRLAQLSCVQFHGQSSLLRRGDRSEQCVVVGYRSEAFRGVRRA